jgi:hypothetical protein
MTNFDATTKAHSIAKDLYFVWRTSERFNFNATPQIIMTKVRKEFSALTPEQQSDVTKLLAYHGADVVKDHEDRAVALQMRTALVPLV